VNHLTVTKTNEYSTYLRCILSVILLYISISIHQTELVNWISAIYVGTLGEIQRQSVCKGVYNALVKNFEKVESVEDVGKPQKRGTIRWRRAKCAAPAEEETK
jgi:hypothetical protein